MNWFHYSLKKVNHTTLKMQEMGPKIYSPYPRLLERLTICRYNYKGSTSSSVILRPWKLVRSGARALDLPQSTLAPHQLTYDPRQKSWHACPLFQYLSRQFISSLPNSMLFIVMKLSLLVSNIVGGKGVPYSSDAISYCFQTSLQTRVPVIWSRRA